ncbi:YdbH family protein [Testudinibacter sp. P27/CKL/0425]
MMKNGLIALGLLLLLIVAALCYLLRASGLQTVANHFLFPDYQISLSQPLETDFDGITLPHFKLQTADCELGEASDLRLTWQSRKLAVQQLELDYACLQQLVEQTNESESKTPFTVDRLWALLPLGELEIAQLTWRNHEALQQPQLQQILAATTYASAVREGSALRLHLRSEQSNPQTGTAHEINDTAVAPNPLLDLNAELVGQKLTATAVYQPDSEQFNQLAIDSELAASFDQLPITANLDFHWRSPYLIIPQGGMRLAWQQQQAKLQLYEVAEQQEHELVSLPFDIQDGNLQISKAQFNWSKDLPQPMNGFLDLNVQSEESRFFWNSFPLKVNFRLSLLSNGEKGKGVIVIQGLNGIIEQNSLHIPLQANGDVKSFDSIFYASLPMQVEGSLHDPVLRFLSGSLLRMNGNTEHIDIEELRLPLAGVVVGQYGVKGRLQAILRGKTRQFERIDLHLDGRANEFIAGIHSIFNIRSAQNVTGLQQAQAIANIWRWNFWGYADIPSLRSVVSLRGRGFWQDNLIKIQLLDGELNKFSLPGVEVDSLKLTLTESVDWDYQQQKLQGALSVNTPKIQFEYGGQFIKPDITVSIQGKDFTDLNLKSELTSDKLGPIRLFSRYQDGILRGNIYWPQQSANVFQPLFPQRWKWLIQRGTIRGQTAFSISPENGVVAGGHVAIQNANIALPDGSISGINFSLPYRYQNQRFQLGVKQPAEVKIAALENGVRLKNVSLQVQGHYPYSRKMPLSLSRLHLELLGGELNVSKFSLPQHNPAFLRLNNIELSEVLELLQYNQLEMSGKVNANLPFWIENSDCIICDGIIEQGSDWRIHLGDELIKEIEQGGGITERILTNLMETMDVYDSNIKVNLLQDGTGLMNAQIKANNALQNPIFLNYNHKENAFDLWSSINFGSELKQNLEYRLQQRQESRRKP